MIVTAQRAELFREIIDGKFKPNDWGNLAEKQLQCLLERFPFVTLDANIVMPNHLHAILIFTIIAKT
jgi:putative transposase